MDRANISEKEARKQFGIGHSRTAMDASAVAIPTVEMGRGLSWGDENHKLNFMKT